MKAKYKNTGETVEVELIGTWNSAVTLYQAKDGRRFPMYALEFEKDIDWEQRRYEIAKDVFASTYNIFQNKGLEKMAVHAADALIAELKKGGKDGQTTE